MNTATIILLNAGNDTSGNSRRCYIGLATNGQITGAWDQNCRGNYVVPEKLQAKAGLAPQFMVTPTEYRDRLKRYGQ